MNDLASLRFDPRAVLDFFTRVIDGATGPVLARLVDAHLSLAGELLLSLGTVVLSLLGWAIAAGKVQSPVQNFAWNAVKIGVFAAVLTVGVYGYYVRDAFHTAIPATIAATAAGGAVSGAAAWDALLNQAWAVGLDVMALFSRFDPMKLLVIVFWGCALAAVVAGYGIWLLGHFMADVYISIGPLFVPFVLFGATRPMFDAWAGALWGTVVLQLLAVVMSTILIGALQQILRAVGTVDGVMLKVGVMFGGAAIFALCTWYARRLPASAATLAGGFHWHPGAIVDATMGAVARLPGAAAGGVAKMLGGGNAQDRGKDRLDPPPNNLPGPTLSESSAARVAA